MLVAAARRSTEDAVLVDRVLHLQLAALADIKSIQVHRIRHLPHIGTWSI